MTPPLYSVVIPTFNRATDLQRCLESLTKQTMSAMKYEIIVVNDGSTDTTKEKVENFRRQNQHIAVILLSQKNKGCAAARNAGIARAQGGVVFFTDDDCVVPGHWLEAHAALHKEYPEAVGVGGWYWPPKDKPYDPFDFFYQLQFELAYPNLANATTHTNTMLSPVGNTANVSYKKSVFKELGGFDERITFTGGEDWEFKVRLVSEGKGFLSIPLHVMHIKTVSLVGFIKKSFRQGRGIHYWSAKYGQEYSLGVYRNFVWLVWRWYTHPITHRRGIGTYLLWLGCVRAGRLFNRVISFAPDDSKQAPPAERFFKRIHS